MLTVATLVDPSTATLENNERCSSDRLLLLLHQQVMREAFLGVRLELRAEGLRGDKRNCRGFMCRVLGGF